jgi:mannose-6-phosphate isomerase-like protein (cupin superfamily)
VLRRGRPAKRVSTSLRKARFVKGGGELAHYIHAMKIDIRRFENPDEQRTFTHGVFELVALNGITIGRARYEPGWKWSTHVGDSDHPHCEVEHVGVVISGRVAVKMKDGTYVEMSPGDIFFIPAGHDSWVVGNEPYVSLHFAGAASYALTRTSA